MNAALDTKNWNLNTYAILVGFVITFGGLVANYTGIQYAQAATQEWQVDHENYHRDIDANSRARNTAVDAEIALLKTQLSKIDAMEWRAAQQEKALESTDMRLNRIAESYSNQFADIRTQMSSISTQMALAIQTLQRIESANPPTQTRGN